MKKTEQQQQAKHLYLQTNLSKTEIANLLNVSRVSLNFWIREGNWDRLKKSAIHLPSLLAENCYHIVARLTEHLLSERRILTPVNSKEADTLHKLTMTISKLKNRSTLNESMEMFAFFLEGLRKKAPDLANQVMPFVDDYLSSRADIYATSLQPASFNEQGLIPTQTPDLKEIQLDMKDIFDWETENLKSIDVEELQQLAHHDNTTYRINGNEGTPDYLKDSPVLTPDEKGSKTASKTENNEGGAPHSQPRVQFGSDHSTLKEAIRRMYVQDKEEKFRREYEDSEDEAA